MFQHKDKGIIVECPFCDKTYSPDLIKLISMPKVPSNQADPTTLEKCYVIINLEHDVLKPFIDIEKDNMTKIIVGQ